MGITHPAEHGWCEDDEMAWWIDWLVYLKQSRIWDIDNDVDKCPKTHEHNSTTTKRQMTWLNIILCKNSCSLGPGSPLLFLQLPSKTEAISRLGEHHLPLCWVFTCVALIRSITHKVGPPSYKLVNKPFTIVISTITSSYPSYNQLS